MTNRKNYKKKIRSIVDKPSLKRLVPKSMRRSLKKIRDTSSYTYDDWIKSSEPGLFHKELSKGSTVISIIVPCYNTPTKYLHPLVDSVKNQTYQHWQLILADGSSAGNPARAAIQEAAMSDERITYLDVGKNLGIVGNTNAGIEEATGEYVGFLDHDDVLSPHALNEVAHVIDQKPKTDLIYSDEDKLSDDGKIRTLPFFKPDWSPDLLLGVNYITHFTVIRKSLANKINGLRKGFDGAQDYDFLLRATEQTKNIVHIPKILYHWRLADGSTATVVTEKDYANTAGQRAIGDAAARRKIKAKVIEIPERPTNYRLQYILPNPTPKVSIIIPFKDKSNLLKQCVGSILEKTTYKNYEIILVSNNSTEEELFTYLETLKENPRCKVNVWDEPFNYSAVNNYGRKQAKGEYLILLNNDTEVITPNWIEELIGVASQPDVGAVGPMLYYSNDTIQHAGIVLGMGGMAGHVFRNHQQSDWTDFGLPCWPRNYLAVTGACLAVSTKKYDQMGGLDETFIVAGNDVAFGIKLYEAGYRNVFWPSAELYHHENASVGSYDSNVPRSDYDHSLTYYRPYLQWNDPYFNMNLDLMNEQIGLRSKYE